MVTNWEYYRSVQEQNRCFLIERKGTYFYRYDHYTRVGQILRSRRNRQQGAHLAMKQHFLRRSITCQGPKGPQWEAAADSRLEGVLGPLLPSQKEPLQ